MTGNGVDPFAQPGPPAQPFLQTPYPLSPAPALPPTPWSRFDAGSGMATIRHPTPLALGQFHTVTLLRSLTQGSLIVGSLAPVNGTSQVRPSPVPLSLAPPHLRSASAIPDLPLSRASSRVWT